MVKEALWMFSFTLVSFFLIGIAPAQAAVSEDYKTAVRSTLLTQIEKNSSQVAKSYKTSTESYFYNEDRPLEIDSLGPSVGDVVGA